MKILWIVGFVLPDAAKAIDSQKIVFGGWVSEMVRELSKIEGINLGVAMKSPVKQLMQKKINNVTYYYLPTNSKDQYDIYEEDCQFTLRDFKPDILHAEGSELAYTLRYLKNWEGNNVVSMQGIINGYEPYEYGGLQVDDLILSLNPRNILFGISMLISKKLKFNNRLKTEKQAIGLAKNILGRTLWDRAHSFALNNDAPYFFCARNLRKSFYAQQWNIEEKETYSLFIGNSSSPRKGAHFVFEAIALLKKEFPNIKLYIAGNPPYPSSATDWKRKIGYSNYLLRLIKRLKLEDNITFLGVLTEKEMAEKLSKIHVYVMASVIENSPNTLGEAMVMGVPSVSSFNGGVPSMCRDDHEVLHYRDNDPKMLAYQVRRIFKDDKLALSLSENGHKRALSTHDRQKNLQFLLDTYKSIMKQP